MRQPQALAETPSPPRPLVTIFAVPKAFSGHIATIQRNAIRSWSLLAPTCEILLFGQDRGTPEIARELGLRHIPDVRTTESGAPLLDDLFQRAENHALGRLLCYVNADIILSLGFAEAVAMVSELRDPFLLVGRRHDLDLTASLVMEEGWERRLAEDVALRGTPAAPNAVDYFLYSPGFWGHIPPFALGRAMWDNWLVYRARQVGARVIDASSTVQAVHQNHDYGHVVGGFEQASRGPESLNNEHLAGRSDHFFSIADATHVLRAGRVVSALDRTHLRRRCEALGILRPILRPLTRSLLLVADATYDLRARLGFALNPKSRGPR